MQPHLDLACAKLNDTQEELKISQDTTSNLAVGVAELKNQLKQLQTTLDTLSLGIDNDAVEMVNALENKVTVDTFQTQFGNVEGKVDDLKDRVEFPPYMWTVTDFWEMVSRVENGREVKIESDSFYLGQHGYKMKLRMYPNGTKEGLKGYTSLFFVLMKGKYDAILPWPFRYEVKFTIIDQNPDLKQRQNFSKSFSPSPALTNMQRPKVEENGGLGFLTFLSHEQLMKSSYVVDETLFIKFEASRCKSV